MEYFMTYTYIEYTRNVASTHREKKTQSSKRFLLEDCLRVEATSSCSECARISAPSRLVRSVSLACCIQSRHPAECAHIEEGVSLYVHVSCTLIARTQVGCNSTEALQGVSVGGGLFASSEAQQRLREKDKSGVKYPPPPPPPRLVESRAD